MTLVVSCALPHAGGHKAPRASAECSTPAAHLAVRPRATAWPSLNQRIPRGPRGSTLAVDPVCTLVVRPRVLTLCQRDSCLPLWSGKRHGPRVCNTTGDPGI